MGPIWALPFRHGCTTVDRLHAIGRKGKKRVLHQPVHSSLRRDGAGVSGRVTLFVAIDTRRSEAPASRVSIR